MAAALWELFHHGPSTQRVLADALCVTARNVTGLVDGWRRPATSHALQDINVPWDAIARVTVEDRSLPSSVWALQPQETEHGTHLNVAVSGRVNVHLALRAARSARGRGEMVVTGISLWVDEPREVVARIRQEVDAQTRRSAS